MKRSIAVAVLVLASVAIAGGLVWGFLAGRGEQAAEAQGEAPVKAPSRVSTEDGHAVLTFDAAAQQANGIETAALLAHTQAGEEQATGVVVQLQPLLDAKVSYTTPASDLVRAQANAQASAAEYARLKLLNQNGKNASDKAVEAARAAAEGDAALVRNAQQTLVTLREGTSLRWGPVLAQWIERDTPAFEALLKQKSLLLQVTGTTAGRFSAPKSAIVQYPDRTHGTAHFLSVLPQLDPRLQVPSTLYITAPHAGLVPGVNVSVFLPAGKEQTGVVVPQTAVVWTQGSAWCYLERLPNTFERQLVPTDQPHAQGWFVAEGIRPGSRVVTAGAQTLLSEEFRSQIQADQD